MEKTLVIADEVEDHQMIFLRRSAQATAYLLQEQYFRFGRPQQHHRIDSRQVDPFIEQIDGKNHLQTARLSSCSSASLRAMAEPAYTASAFTPTCRNRSAMNCA